MFGTVKLPVKILPGFPRVSARSYSFIWIDNWIGNWICFGLLRSDSQEDPQEPDSRESDSQESNSREYQGKSNFGPTKS